MNIIISKANLQLLSTLYMQNQGLEIGGVLLGKKDHDNYIITDIAYNINNTSLSQFNFTRNISDVKDIMVQLIAESNYEIDYIGEWHTHPNFSSSYSMLDKHAMLKLNKDFAELILIIKSSTHISAYLFTIDSIKELEIIRGEAI